MRRSIITTFAVSWLVAGACVGQGFEREAQAAVYGPTTVVSVSVFYDNLAPYGRWVDTGPYGWCWVPDMVPVVWRPYSDGYWVYTDFGWAWVSDEPWGWATYHYGRWFEDPVYGWMWVPGTDWAPAWVAWRESPEWVGWAPLPPTATWSAWSGLRFEAVSIPAPCWSFVERPYMAQSSLRLAAVSHNVGLLSRTHDATRFAVRSGRPVDEGISLAAFERQTGRRVPRLRIVDAMGPQRGHAATDGAVAFFRPRVRREPGAMPLSRAVERRMNRPAPVPRGAGTERIRNESQPSIEPGRFQRSREAQPQRPSFESMRGQRQAQRQAFEQRQAEQRARFREQWMRGRQAQPQEGQPPVRMRRGDQGQPRPRAERGNEGGSPLRNAVEQRQGQNPPPQRAQHGRRQSDQSADQSDPSERKDRGKKNGPGG